MRPSSFSTRALALEETRGRPDSPREDLFGAARVGQGAGRFRQSERLDPSDAAVKEWLPQFELLTKFLPRIKALDAQIGKSPGRGRSLAGSCAPFHAGQSAGSGADGLPEAMKLGPG